MTMMLSGAVLIHCSIVGVGAMWQQPVTAPKDDVPYIDIDGPPPGPAGGEVQILPVPNNAPAGTPESSTPSPETPSTRDPTPPEIFPDMKFPAEATPPPRTKHTVSRTGNLSAAASLSQTSASASGAPAGNSRGPASSPGNGGAGVRAWKMPKPPYPRTVMTTGPQGATTVRITTDANGNVATVEIVRSTGNALLDHHTQTYVREFWKGPPNASRTTEFIYEIR